MSLTIAQFKEHVTTTLGDDALQRLLDDADEAIIERAGPAIDDYLVTSVTEWFSPHGDRIMLSRRASSIVEVLEHAQRETPTTLGADDYELSASGTILRRLRGGTNSATRWHPDVSVEYAPYSDAANRQRVQLALVKLDIASNPGLASQTVGAWTEQYSANSVWNYQVEREAILATLHPDPVVMF